MINIKKSNKNCQCAFCKAKRGEYKSKDNPNYRNGSRTITEKICLYCHKKFIAEANRKYCSRSCMNLYIWKYTNKTQKISMKTTGRKLSKETKMKMRKNHADVVGTKNPNWKNGIDSLRGYIYRLSEYKQWRNRVFKRDHYTCQECSQIGYKLHVHHKKYLFSEILKDFLNYYNQFSPIEDKETLVRLAITYEPFWDIDNGETLCKDCHNQIHKGSRKNDKYKKI